MTLDELKCAVAALPSKERHELADFVWNPTPADPSSERKSDALFNPGRLMKQSCVSQISIKHDDFLYGVSPSQASTVDEKSTD